MERKDGCATLYLTLWGRERARKREREGGNERATRKENEDRLRKRGEERETGGGKRERGMCFDRRYS